MWPTGGRRPTGLDQAGAEEGQKLLSRQPPVAIHELAFHQRDVGRGAAERDRAELQEDESEIRDVLSPGKLTLGHGGRVRQGRRFGSETVPS